MNIQTKNLIKLLEIDQEQKQKLWENYDNLQESVKTQIVRMLWLAFDNLYNIQLQKNIDEGLNKIEKKEDSADKGFYKRMVNKTNKDMENMMNTASDKTDLENARQAMELIVREIRAAKMLKKTNLSKSN